MTASSFDLCSLLFSSSESDRECCKIPSCMLVPLCRAAQVGHGSAVTCQAGSAGRAELPWLERCRNGPFWGSVSAFSSFLCLSQLLSLFPSVSL